MAIVINSIYQKEVKPPHVGLENLHFYKALAASQAVFNCESLDEAYTKLEEGMSDEFIVYQGGHHVAILLRQEGTHEGIPLVSLGSTTDVNMLRWEALQLLHDFAVKV